MANTVSKHDRVVLLYYLGKFIQGLRFFIPIWMIFGLKFTDLSGLAIIETVTFLATVIVDIPSGALADIIGRKRVVIIGLILMGCGHIFLGFATNLWGYVLLCFVCNIGGSFISGSDTALLYDHLKEQGESEKFIKTQSLASFTFRAGIVVASFLGGWLYNQAPALPFVLMGAAELTAIVCWIFITEPKIDTQKFSWKSYRGKMQKGIGEILQNKYIRLLTLFYVLIGCITFSSLYFFDYSYAYQLGFSANEQSLIFGFTGIAKALALLAIAGLATKFDRKKVFWVFALLMVATYLPAVFAPTAIAVLIISFAETLAAARFALLDKFVNDELQSEHRATALSAINMLVNLGYLIIVFLGGNFADRYGTGSLYSIFGVVALLVLLPLTWKLTRGTPQLN